VAGGKWISDPEATTPVADAARHVLTVRLEVVRDYLPLAPRRSRLEKSARNVHQIVVKFAGQESLPASDRNLAAARIYPTEDWSGGLSASGRACLNRHALPPQLFHGNRVQGRE
jgi:hypothetical protein